MGTSIVQFKLDLALLYSLMNYFLSLYNINDTRTFFCLALHIVLTDPSFISLSVFCIKLVSTINSLMIEFFIIPPYANKVNCAVLLVKSKETG